MTEALGPVWAAFTDFAPRLLGGMLVFLAVFVVALLLKRFVGEFLRRVGLDDLFERTGTAASLRRVGISIPPSSVLAQVLFWTVLLAGVAAFLSILGLSSLQGNLDMLVGLVGRGLVAVVILAAGLVAAGWLSSLAVSEADRTGISGGDILQKIVFGIVIVVAALLAAAQLGIDVSLLILLSMILFGTLGLVSALALGLGLAPLSTNVAAARYVQANIQIGDRISIDGVEGIVEDLNYAAMQLKTDDGDLHFVPNRAMMEAAFSKRDGRLGREERDEERRDEERRDGDDDSEGPDRLH